MKLTDLLKNRDKLRKYDELKEWKESFHNMVDIPTWNALFGYNNVISLPLPDHIKAIIVNALDAEIKKLEEE